MQFWQGYPRRGALPFPAHFIREYMMSISLIAGTVNLDLVKRITSQFLHCQITVLSPGILGRLVPGPCGCSYMDVQMPYIKCHCICILSTHIFPFTFPHL